MILYRKRLKHFIPTYLNKHIAAVTNIFMRHIEQPNIRDLALIGDQKSCALIDKNCTIAWYCLWRFDQPSLFSLLIDEQGGYWSVDAAGKVFSRRSYKDDTAILKTEFNVDGGSFTITDFMPAATEMAGICRLFTPSPVPVTIRLFPKPDYGRSPAKLKRGEDDTTVADNKFEYYIKGSHPLSIQNGIIEMVIPKDESGWCVLVDDKRAVQHVCLENLLDAQQKTAAKWHCLMSNIVYEGVYKEQLYQSYKALQLLTHEHSGGILAAATTSCPERAGGKRNYDYRYVWLRDTAMDVRALVRASSKGGEAERFLDFLCAARNTNKKDLFVPFYDLDNKTAPEGKFIPGTGYKGSKPIRIGNDAYDQLQLDAQGNVLLAAKEIYNKNGKKPHRETIVRTADFLVDNWHQKDHGIWEENVKEHFTSSKVLVVRGLEFIAEYADDERQKQKWLNTAKEVRLYILNNCMTKDGAYAVYAGSNAVDITAALYAVWGYDQPDSPAMRQTVKRIEEEYREGELYYRHLIQFNSKREGVFLAGSLWMALYYIGINNLNKAKSIIDAVLSFSTDLGFLPEEGNVKTGELLGNLPQAFVHASLIGAIVRYNKAINESGDESKDDY